MKKATISSLIMIAMLVGAYVFVTSRDSLAEEQSTTTQSTTTQQDTSRSSNEAGQVSGTLPELMAMNRSLSCTLDKQNVVEGEAQISGQVYISDDNRMRGNFTVTDPEAEDEVKMHTIHEEDRIYTWSELRPDGTVVRVNESDMTIGGDAAVGQDAGVTYTCEDWEADETVFSPPEDREFVDITSEVRSFQERMQNVEENVTMEDCEELQSEARTEECRQILQQQQGSQQQQQLPQPQP